MALGQRSSRGTSVSNNGSHGPAPAHAITRYLIIWHLDQGQARGYGRITHFFVIAPRDGHDFYKADDRELTGDLFQMPGCRMKNMNIIPFTWTNKFSEYTCFSKGLGSGVWAVSGILTSMAINLFLVMKWWTQVRKKTFQNSEYFNVSTKSFELMLGIYERTRKISPIYGQNHIERPRKLHTHYACRWPLGCFFWYFLNSDRRSSNGRRSDTGDNLLPPRISAWRSSVDPAFLHLYLGPFDQVSVREIGG